MMLDLFDHPAASSTPRRDPDRPRPALPCPSVPEGGIAWQRLIATLDEADLVMAVSPLWTKVVLEVASDPAFGRKMLRRDGQIVDLPPDASRGRLVYLDVPRARELNSTHGLALIDGPGSKMARFRFAPDGRLSSDVEAILDTLAAATPSHFL